MTREQGWGAMPPHATANCRLPVWARAASPHRALVNRAALRLGRPASIPRARASELLAGGTRERGSPSAIAITAPFPGAAVNRSRRCTRSRVPPLRVGAMLTLLREPLSPRPRVVFAFAPPAGLSSIIVRLCEIVGRFSYHCPHHVRSGFGACGQGRTGLS